MTEGYGQVIGRWRRQMAAAETKDALAVIVDVFTLAVALEAARAMLRQKPLSAADVERQKRLRGALELLLLKYGKPAGSA